MGCVGRGLSKSLKKKTTPLIIHSHHENSNQFICLVNFIPISNLPIIIKLNVKIDMKNNIVGWWTPWNNLTNYCFHWGTNFLSLTQACLTCIPSKALLSSYQHIVWLTFSFVKFFKIKDENLYILFFIPAALTKYFFTIIFVIPCQSN